MRNLFDLYNRVQSGNTFRIDMHIFMPITAGGATLSGTLNIAAGSLSIASTTAGAGVLDVSAPSLSTTVTGNAIYGRLNAATGTSNAMLLTEGATPNVIFQVSQTLLVDCNMLPAG